MSLSQLNHTKLPKLLNKCTFPTLCYVVGIAATVGRAFSGVGQPPVMGVVADALAQQGFHSRGTITTIYFLSIILAAVLMPLAGYLFDILGARRTGLIVIFLLSASCFLFAYGNIHESISSLLLVFVSIRFFGQGALNLVSTNMINQWWTKERRVVQGWSSFVYSFVMFGILPPWMMWLQNKYGWQHTLGILGSIILCVMVPVCYLFYMNDIHMYGFTSICDKDVQRYPIDDEEYEMNQAYWPSEEEEEDDFIPNLPHYSNNRIDKQNSLLLFSPELKQDEKALCECHWIDAMSSCYFWKFSWCCFSWGFLTTGLFFHLNAIYLKMNVYGITSVSNTFLLIGLFSAIFSLFPVYIDTTNGLRPLRVSMFLLGLSLLVVNFIHLRIFEWLLGVAIGGVMGMMNVYSVVLLAEWFGTKHIGKIAGINQAITQLGSALGPLVLLKVANWTDSYLGPLLVCSIWPFLTILWLH
ncbi:MFS transporter [Galdieria sulphuraria]|uniref:MFS transporter n=1 Tax=Galdieria sulphuraria TaxID=130081 RepID=M2XHY2_GALSU|nr:MFS transporter [Galdieria sulphuraria]EME29707.1 MFS transporter [Galdieria sulphuraria]|eukprot:XP_005706227.1 MFS transporter [Galdieria sulphuraria]